MWFGASIEASYGCSWRGWGGAVGEAPQPANDRLLPRSRRPQQVSAAAAAESPAQGEKWIDPAFHNKNAVRAALICGVVAAASKGAVLLPGNVATYIHLLSYGVVLGAQVYTTFFAGITMFRNLPRQMFGKVQSRLFPIYFALSAACFIAMIGTAAALGALGQKQLVTLGVGLVSVLINLFGVEPWTTKIMFERYDLENTGQGDGERAKALRKQFGAAHGISSLVNLSTLVCLFEYGWQLAGKLAL